MIIDAHTHLGKKNIVATAAELIASMDSSGIDKSLVLAGKINDHATEEMLIDIAPYEGRLYGIGSVSPTTFAMDVPFLSYKEEYRNVQYDKVRQMEEAFAAGKIYGLKFYPGYEYFYPYDEMVRPFLRLCIKYNKPAIFHSGDLYNKMKNAKLKYAHPLTFDDLAVDMPDLKIIIAHMGYPFVREAAEVCYKNDNVYSDTSGFVYGDFAPKDVINYFEMVKEFVKISGGSHKVIFGTDWPISNQKDYVLYTQSALRDKEHDLEQIMGARAANLFGIV